MEFDWISPSFKIEPALPLHKIEEAFEDPFSLRLAPDGQQFAGRSRYFCLGKTMDGKGIFSVYRSNGKQVRVISVRSLTTEEEHYYERKKQEHL